MIIKKEKGININEIYEYDERSNCIHIKDSRGHEVREEFDEYNHITHSIDNILGEVWCKYNIDGNLRYFKNCDNSETWFDKDGNIMYYKSNR